ncbi:DUF2384 domain-containing protein [Phyllobacterium salinisoli]|uniref:DUF2384 domain-containing protein n=1 Tax=Phyllobacterium salinisoli TaxID=1899321 RepID=A0A368K0D0_9HYPH|nr:antitoxin Xre/MbcA/ParS toxin-binding domain-containing protein [Phyllobacterium salinisoli]RCS22115.1 DUF2384 domain-containing protein [Phyllobacterium salinisoli]
MVSPNTQIERPRRVAHRVATKVANALKTDEAFQSGSLDLSAHIAGAAAAAVVNLTPEARLELNKHRTELGRRIRQLVEAFGDEPKKKIMLEAPDVTEDGHGEGLGEVVSEQQGEGTLRELAVARRLEEWAGEVAGATELSRDYGVPRSSLNRWQHAGDVVALLKGTKKHVYPVEQFVDGRPARGIGDVSRLTANQRITWVWLSRPNPTLGGRKPIDLLKQERIDDVLEAAKSYFTPQ